ncbi:T9SS type A sorting domain-containing protein [Lewinella sp. LCG006]|uniref:T9SS type A sorting domain-containing protein n=1 Tax=Lewinella sp. LCG006 TaxID=3231911 RepID=UPI00345FDB97
MNSTSAYLTILLSVCFSLAVSAQTLVSISYKGQRSQEVLTQQYGFLIQNGVELWKITYTTPDVFNQLDTASGLLILPVRDETTIYPTLIYQHGTVDGPQDVPSNLQGGYQLGLVFGGLGYVTLAPDYLGAGTSRGFHPYVHAASEASAAVDMLRAVRGYASQIDLLLNDQLFVTGYSQGGHASMALHRALELELADEFDLTAASHMSGPYSISGVMRELMVSEEPYNFLAYLPNTYLSYNYVYDFYDDLEQFFKPAYTTAIRNFYEGNIGLGALNNFLITNLTNEYGAPIARYMLQDSIVTILEEADPNHPVIEALANNDTYEWAPQQPTRILYCTADDQVKYRNSIVADSVMQALGAVDLITFDVNPTADHGGCVEPAVIQTALFFNSFADWTVDTREIGDDLAVRVFPNPVREKLQIYDLQEAAEVRMLNQQGQLVLFKELSAGQQELMINTLTPGIYWLQIRTQSGQAVRKMIVE